MDRLQLRQLTPEDGKNLFSLTSQEEVARFMRFDTQRSLEEAEALLREYLEPQNAAFAVLIEDTFAGVFVLKAVKPEETTSPQTETGRQYTISIFLSPAFWNQGYTTEIIRRMKAYSREKLHADSLLAYVVEENTGSKRALEKCGFFVEEILHFPDLPGGLFVYRCNLPAENR